MSPTAFSPAGAFELGKLISYIRGFASKLEAEKIKERTARGRKAKAKQGKISSGSHAHLYGYTYIKISEAGGGKRVIKLEEAEWVKKIFTWLVEEGMSTSAITCRLQALGVPTPSGKGYWKRSAVMVILKNIAYTGKTYANTMTYGLPTHRRKPDGLRRRTKTGLIWRPKEEWIEIPDVTPTIISETMFEAAQKQLHANKEKATRNIQRQYLLHGHLRCLHCGRAYWGSPAVKLIKGKRYEFRYYRCSGAQKRISP